LTNALKYPPRLFSDEHFETPKQTRILPPVKQLKRIESVFALLTQRA
jgi:hypothetical protein